MRTVKFDLRNCGSLDRNCPLHARIPLRDEDGGPLTDFMVLVCGLRAKPGHRQRSVAARLQAVLADFSEVVFADLNVPLGLLWVSLIPKQGMTAEVFSAIKHAVPEARLVGPYTFSD